MEWVAEKEASDAPGDRRILPALRGRLEKSRSELAEMESAFQARLVGLLEKQRVSPSHRLVLASVFQIV